MEPKFRVDLGSTPRSATPGRTFAPVAPEARIERALVDAARKAGGRAVKCAGTAWRGFPDRMVLGPGGRVAFVEVKRPGGKPRKSQVACHRVLRGLGFAVYVLDDRDAIPALLRECGLG